MDNRYIPRLQYSHMWIQNWNFPVYFNANSANFGWRRTRIVMVFSASQSLLLNFPRSFMLTDCDVLFVLLFVELPKIFQIIDQSQWRLLVSDYLSSVCFRMFLFILFNKKCFLLLIPWNKNMIIPHFWCFFANSLNKNMISPHFWWVTYIHSEHILHLVLYMMWLGFL